MLLFISEGNAIDKTSAIRSSDYLNFAYNELATSSGRIAVYGHSLGEANQHLVRAIERCPYRTIAFGVYATDQEHADLERARVKVLFPKAELRVFDSSTHPFSR